MARRILVTLFIIVTINFFLPRAMKSDPFLYLSDDGSGLVTEYTDEQIAHYRIYYGLDKPIINQYLDYLKNIFTGNFGYSIHLMKPVGELILSRVFWTIGLVLASQIVSVLIGVLLGSFSAWFRDSVFDRILYSINIMISQIPGFIIGSLVLLFFSVTWRVLPTSGGITAFRKISFDLPTLTDLARHAVLPVLTLTMLHVPDYYLTMRASMIKEIDKQYIFVAESKGISRSKRIFKHSMVNSISPLITRVMMTFGRVFGGAIIAENIFSYPGVGRLMRDAVFFRDYILIQGIFFVITLIVLLFSTINEIYHRIDKNLMGGV